MRNDLMVYCIIWWAISIIGFFAGSDEAFSMGCLIIAQLYGIGYAIIKKLDENNG